MGSNVPPMIPTRCVMSGILLGASAHTLLPRDNQQETIMFGRTRAERHREVSPRSTAGHDTRAFGSQNDLAPDPRPLTFKTGRLDEFKAYVAVVQTLWPLLAPASSEGVATSEGDLAAQLQNLSDLHASGVLSAQDFAPASARLA
jgi:hypothetical protein